MVTIRTRLVNVRDSLLHFGYEIVRDEDGTVLAEGETVHIVVDSEFKRIPLPQRYLPSFLKAAGKTNTSSERRRVNGGTGSWDTCAAHDHFWQGTSRKLTTHSKCRHFTLTATI